MAVQYAHTRVFGCPLVEADEYGLTIINESFASKRLVHFNEEWLLARAVLRDLPVVPAV